MHSSCILLHTALPHAACVLLSTAVYLHTYSQHIPAYPCILPLDCCIVPCILSIDSCVHLPTTVHYFTLLYAPIYENTLLHAVPPHAVPLTALPHHKLCHQVAYHPLHMLPPLPVLLHQVALVTSPHAAMRGGSSACCVRAQASRVYESVLQVHREAIPAHGPGN